MKKIKIKITFVCLLLLLNNGISAQIHLIDRLRIIPAFPTNNDSVKIICSAYFPSGGCLLSNSSVTVATNTITVNAEHILGMLTYICHSVDTITIGKLETGNYELYYHIYDPQYTLVNEIDTISFTIYNPTGNQAIKKSTEEISIYPNPLGDRLQIESNNQGQVELYTIQGQLLKSIKHDNFISTIDVTALPKGIYLLKLMTKNEVLTKKIIKN